MTPEEISKFLEETECQNMLLSVLRSLLYISNIKASPYFYISNTTFFNNTNLGNCYLYTRDKEKTNPVWQLFKQNPDELSKILQVLVKPIDVEIVSSSAHKVLDLIKIECKRILTKSEIKQTGLCQGFRIFFERRNEKWVLT